MNMRSDLFNKNFLLTILLILLLFSLVTISILTYKLNNSEIVIDNSIYNNITLFQYDKVNQTYNLSSVILLEKQVKEVVKTSNDELGNLYKETYQDLINTLIWQITIFGILFTFVLVIGGFLLFTNVKDIEDKFESKLDKHQKTTKSEIEKNIGDVKQGIEKLEKFEDEELRKIDYVKELLIDKISNLELSFKNILDKNEIEYNARLNKLEKNNLGDKKNE